MLRHPLMGLRRRAAAAAAAGTAAAATTALFWQQPASTQPKSANTVLFAKHRVILGWWPVAGAVAANDPRTSSLRACVAHAQAAGYEGCEFSTQDIKSTFFNESTPTATVIAEAKQVAPPGFFPGGELQHPLGTGPHVRGAVWAAPRPHMWARSWQARTTFSTATTLPTAGSGRRTGRCTTGTRLHTGPPSAAPWRSAYTEP